ncbi:MAG TPA: hypothetical protein VFN07_00935 [Trueperaceae bacterium]|nr:hypothetical protein [Trueperaceae bacterium]
MARRSKATPKKLGEFLDLLATNGNVTISAQELNLDRRKLYRLRDEQPEFAAAWDSAMAEAADHLEAEARRRAVEGWHEPVFYQGDEVGYVRRFSDTLLIFLMKGANPEKYRERSSTELSGPGGAPLAQGLVQIYLPGNGRDELEGESTVEVQPS